MKRLNTKPEKNGSADPVTPRLRIFAAATYYISYGPLRCFAASASLPVFAISRHADACRFLLIPAALSDVHVSVHASVPIHMAAVRELI